MFRFMQHEDSYVTAVENPRHLTLPWASWIQNAVSHPVTSRMIPVGQYLQLVPSLP